MIRKWFKMHRRYDLFDAMENKPSCYEAKFEDGLFCFSNGGK